MTILEFDEIEKYTEVKEWLLSLTPSQLMEKKREAVDVVWDLLTYLYMLGFTQATEEVGETIAEEVKSVLPKDYEELTALQIKPTESPKVKDFADLTKNQQVEANKEIYKQFDNKDFQDRVSQYAELGDTSKILKVVETDGNRVYNAGGYNGAKGRYKYKTWVTMMDDKVRDTHDYLEGITIPIEDKFVTYDGDEARFPGDFSDPSNVINCRCELSYS